ncbi:hypothetical protein [Caulobacter sp. 17J80-11]|uniref:hypothetical protein n=1 Tax=Caulobacter sp. 17J80-11 TaxID=2763502 RepID=UPI0016539767|nr:hypothetical protein [Caulobacter sp. 17J80-11]MBC6981387.1 hypothetical protein [Caulobacter sp. 17J80-11]
MANKPKDLSLGLGAVIAFLLPASVALNSRMHAPDLAPEERSGATTGLILATIVISLIVALVAYLVRRYLIRKNAKSDRSWDAFTLFFILAIAGSVVARFVPLSAFAP